MGFAVLAFRGGEGGIRKRNVLRQIRATSSAKVRDRAGGSGGGADHRLEWCRCLRQRCAQAASNYSGCDRKGKFRGGKTLGDRFLEKKTSTRAAGSLFL